jgi:hypothetical protein
LSDASAVSTETNTRVSQIETSDCEATHVNWPISWMLFGGETSMTLKPPGVRFPKMPMSPQKAMSLPLR